jgi:hypothetical protein
MSEFQTTDGSSTLTARDLLCPDPSALRTAIEVALQEGDLPDAPPSTEPGSASRFVVTQAAKALEEILAALEIDQLLLGGWTQLQEVTTLVNETRRLGTTRNLALVSHTITSEHQPSLELVVNEIPKKLLDLLITFEFPIAFCDLVIDRGEVTGVELGHVTARSEVSAQNYTILERETAELDPTRLFTTLRQPLAPPR